MIHKIEIYPHYTYPIIPSHGSEATTTEIGQNCFLNSDMNMSPRKTDQIIRDKLRLDSTNSSNNSAVNLVSPYRTVSHYGFNYPLTYMPNITLNPICSITPVDLQRQKVVAFIKRLNIEAQVNDQQLNYFNKTRIMKTGKEENIYENTLINHLDNTVEETLDTAGSFISVAEIQLNSVTKGKLSSNVGHVKRSENQKHTRSINNQSDLQSGEFSSLLSISGTYPAATHSNICDGENDHFTNDSGDNSSNFELHSSRKCTQENLYSSYLRRNFIPEMINTHPSIMDLRDADGEEEPDPHKPESEQRSQVNVKHSPKYISNDENKHVTLTLNSLKRRASSLCEKKFCKSNDKSLSFRTQFSDANSSSDSSTVSTAIEIHINVNIRNSDCVKNLKNHEQEFKSKLEKVIDDEINLITQELNTSVRCEDGSKNNNNSAAFNINPIQRCLSAPDSIFLYGRDTSYTEVDRHSLFNFNDSAHTSPFRQSSAVPSNPCNMRYRQTLAILEHELEMLLNNIIRNMCDCKTKITQISEDIRTASLHVGPLNDKTSKKENKMN